MIKVLIIDDQEFKLSDIKSKINHDVVESFCAMDLYSAKMKIISNKFDLILLDMTLQEIMNNNEFGGLDILQYLDEEEILTPVIVLTQFYNYKDLSYSEENRGMYMENEYYKKEVFYDTTINNDIHELPNLHVYLSKNFMNYFGCVLYMQSDTVWVENLKKMLFKLGGQKYESIIT